MNEENKPFIAEDGESPADPEKMRATMDKFYSRLNGKQRRALRLAHRRVTGKRESISEMCDRIHRTKP